MRRCIGRAFERKGKVEGALIPDALCGHIVDICELTQPPMAAESM